MEQRLEVEWSETSNWHRNHTVPHCQYGADIKYDDHIIPYNIIIAIQLFKNSMTVVQYPHRHLISSDVDDRNNTYKS